MRSIPDTTNRRGFASLNAAKKRVAAEHLPELQSQCIYGAGSQPGQVGYMFKLMLLDMFDVDKLDDRQLDFNATFANGGAAPDTVMQSPGERAYVFYEGDRASLFVVTGFKWLDDVTGRPRVLTALHYLDHPDMDCEAKLGALLIQSRLHMQHWTQQLGRSG